MYLDAPVYIWGVQVVNDESVLQGRGGAGGGSVDEVDRRGCTALMLAAERGRTVCH
jgi:hypothetical protein